MNTLIKINFQMSRSRSELTDMEYNSSPSRSMMHQYSQFDQPKFHGTKSMCQTWSLMDKQARLTRWLLCIINPSNFVCKGHNNDKKEHFIRNKLCYLGVIRLYRIWQRELKMHPRHIIFYKVVNSSTKSEIETNKKYQWMKGTC